MKKISLCSAKVLVGRGSGGAIGGQVSGGTCDTGAGLLKAGIAAAFLIAVSACAEQQATPAESRPVAGGAVQTQLIEVATRPGSAECILTRAGRVIGTIYGTPGSFSAVKGNDDLLVTCSKDGHHAATERLVPTGGGGIAARLVPAGMTPDRAGPRTGRYPNRVMLYLTPTRFEDEYARRQHGRMMRQRIAAEAESAKRAVARDCQNGLFSGSACGTASRAIDDRVAAELRLLDRQLRSARMVPDR